MYTEFLREITKLREKINLLPNEIIDNSARETVRENQTIIEAFFDALAGEEEENGQG